MRGPTGGELDLLTIDLLQRVPKRRTIEFPHDLRPHSHSVVRTDPEDVGVIGGVVDLAHGDAIGHNGLATFGVGQDVGGVEKARVTKTANRALVLVGEEDTLTKERLVQTSFYNPLLIRPDEIRIF